MLTSFTFLQNSLEKYNTYKKNNENYSKWDSAQAGLGSGLVTGFLVIAVVFFALELLVLFFAINVALKCTKGGPERTVHVVLAIVFTLPYMLLNLLFNKCASDVIKGDSFVGVTEPVKMGFGMGCTANKIN
jgi:hypothetical protein